MSTFRWILNHFEDVICCICLVILAVAVFAQVLARYVFSVALHWTEETAAMAMVWAVYMGAAMCVRERYHIRIIIGVQAFPEKIGRVIVFVADAFWAAFCLFMVKVSYDYLLVMWKFPTISPSMGINQFYPQSILVIGYGLMLIRLIQLYIGWYREGGHGIPGMLEEEFADTTKDHEVQI